MSAAAKACAGKSGGEKSACMRQYKANATKAQISAMQKGLSSCAQSKNPEKCKAAIARKVDKLKSRLSKLS
jgi:hypothetical protein